MTEPEYHKQPTTFDPKQPEIPEDAPLAQGHSRELADEVREADIEHTAAVEQEAKDAQEREADGESPEVGPRAPGDHAGETSASSDGGSDDSCPPQGSIDEVLAWVGDDSDRASAALEAEQTGQQRTTLISKLEAIAE